MNQTKISSYTVKFIDGCQIVLSGDAPISISMEEVSNGILINNSTMKSYLTVNLLRIATSKSLMNYIDFEKSITGSKSVENLSKIIENLQEYSHLIVGLSLRTTARELIDYQVKKAIIL